jgi:trigger factor
VLDVVAGGGEVEVPEVMVHEKAHEMVDSFERSIRSQGMDPEQYYELAGTDHAGFEERVTPDAEDTVKKELVLDAVATAEGIVADEEEVMHEIGHLAEDSERSPEEVAEVLRANGTYAMLEEEISRQKALDFLVENAVPVPMSEEELEEELEEAEADPEESVEPKAAATQSEEREE